VLKLYANSESSFYISRTAQAIIMSTMSVAQAMAFAPNFSKGLMSAGKIFQLLARVPAVKDKQGAIEGPLVCLRLYLSF